ncbi:MAG: hypothetical protein QGH97_00830 [Dehalococcoidia bacterium]|jgi:hypothetical protein|nr:hypothetical protein [Dehalococcoidia bacterium]MDP7082906.1 hypothetical protein [Dehalococcoidia bacterium]MDP7200099.1 hypothetical protein [Dehalococcoidia bacterium]MDP7511679.1 hypothetical protein [Dehalococcoidia bacterium]HJN86684.1 hypothetical protein [Dehalococcoidia bacterium]
MAGRYSSPAADIADYWEFFELALSQGWTDGLPLCPPTEDRVGAVIDYLGRDPQESLGVIEPQKGVATIEQVAINCVMAGCTPQMVPVVIAAIEAMLEPEFNLHGVQSTTNPCSPLVIVNGPIARDLGFNVREGAFGGGSRANAAIGRAVRLVLWNIGGGIPGVTDMSTLGSPAKFSFCVAENEESSPWTLLHEERAGMDRDQNAVTVFACQSPNPLFAPGKAERILKVLACSLPTVAINMFHSAGQCLISFSGKVAQELDRGGYSKEALKEWLWKNAGYNVGWLKQSGILVGQVGDQHYWGHAVDDPPNPFNLPDDAILPMVETPDDIHVAVVGGESQWWVGFSAGWGAYGGYAVTKAITLPGSN